jgi:hypothetical protein
VFELVGKILSEGFNYYLKDRFNWFDGAVVLISAIDVALQYSLKNGKLNELMIFSWKQKWS